MFDVDSDPELDKKVSCAPHVLLVDHHHPDHEDPNEDAHTPNVPDEQNSLQSPANLLFIIIKEMIRGDVLRNYFWRWPDLITDVVHGSPFFLVRSYFYKMKG